MRRLETVLVAFCLRGLQKRLIQRQCPVLFALCAIFSTRMIVPAEAKWVAIASYADGNVFFDSVPSRLFAATLLAVE